MTMVIANNMIYGMTGGQCAHDGDRRSRFTAPTEISNPFRYLPPAESRGTYVARSTAYHAVQTIRFIERAILHKAFVGSDESMPTQYGPEPDRKRVEMLKWLKERLFPWKEPGVQRRGNAGENRDGRIVNKESPNIQRNTPD